MWRGYEPGDDDERTRVLVRRGGATNGDFKGVPRFARRTYRSKTRCVSRRDDVGADKRRDENHFTLHQSSALRAAAAAPRKRASSSGPSRSTRSRIVRSFVL